MEYSTKIECELFKPMEEMRVYIHGEFITLYMYCGYSYVFNKNTEELTEEFDQDRWESYYCDWYCSHRGYSLYESYVDENGIKYGYDYSVELGEFLEKNPGFIYSTIIKMRKDKFNTIEGFREKRIKVLKEVEKISESIEYEEKYLIESEELGLI